LHPTTAAIKTSSKNKVTKVSTKDKFNIILRGRKIWPGNKRFAQSSFIL